jgi:hypothetical protein
MMKMKMKIKYVNQNIASVLTFYSDFEIWRVFAINVFANDINVGDVWVKVCDMELIH